MGCDLAVRRSTEFPPIQPPIFLRFNRQSSSSTANLPRLRPRTFFRGERGLPSTPLLCPFPALGRSLDNSHPIWHGVLVECVGCGWKFPLKRRDPMNKKTFAFSLMIACALALQPALAQDTSLSFFITSAGPGNGAALGGLAGADAHCQKLEPAAKPGAPTSVRARRMARRLSTPAIASAKARGTTPRVCKSPRTWPTCTPARTN